MAVYFLDSSALVKRYTSEVGTSFVLRIVRPKANNFLSLVRITGVEAVSALTRKGLTNQLSLQQVQKALRRFEREFPNFYFKVEVTSVLVASAMGLAKTHGLRGYDAVQLAAAKQVQSRQVKIGGQPMIFVCADNELNQAAIAEGLTVENPNNYP